MSRKHSFQTSDVRFVCFVLLGDNVIWGLGIFVFLNLLAGRGGGGGGAVGIGEQVQSEYERSKKL